MGWTEKYNFIQSSWSAEEDPLASPWAKLTGQYGFAIYYNGILASYFTTYETGGQNQWCTGYWTGTVSDNQYSKLDIGIGHQGNENYIGPAVRVSNGTGNTLQGYYLQWEGYRYWNLNRIENGVVTTLDSGDIHPDSIIAGQMYCSIEYVDGKVSAYYGLNGTQEDTLLGEYTDASPLPTGKCGVFGNTGLARTSIYGWWNEFSCGDATLYVPSSTGGDLLGRSLLGGGIIK